VTAKVIQFPVQAKPKDKWRPVTAESIVESYIVHYLGMELKSQDAQELKIKLLRLYFKK
jgi:hypothetical protein